MNAEMTPKQRYEARKAERLSARRQHPQQAFQTVDRDEEIHDLFDRFVTAVERIADVLESKGTPA